MKLYPIFNLAFYLICSWMITESAHATTITPSDLLPGDLIFFMDANDTQADHVALFSGIKKDGQPYVIHAVTQPHHAIVNTLLKAQEFTSYFVVRNHNLSLTRCSPSNEDLG